MSNRPGWSSESSTKRGYDYRWQQTRKRILERDCYLCKCDECKRTGALKPANEVNHIVSKAEAKRLGWTRQQTDAESNLHAINADCHKRVTLEQRGYRPRQAIGPDGWPT